MPEEPVKLFKDMFQLFTPLLNLKHLIRLNLFTLSLKLLIQHLPDLYEIPTMNNLSIITLQNDFNDSDDEFFFEKKKYLFINIMAYYLYQIHTYLNLLLILVSTYFNFRILR